MSGLKLSNQSWDCLPRGIIAVCKHNVNASEEFRVVDGYNSYTAHGIDLDFSNWDLLYDKHKQFFKQNGKEMINIIYQAQDSSLGRRIMDENKKNELLNLIEIL